MDSHPSINAELLETVLRREHCDSSITVQEFKVVAALEKGENYSSDILRATIHYSAGHNNQRTQKYIIKASLNNAEMAEILDEYDVFYREIIVYRDIMPKIEQLLLSVGDKSKIAPICHSISEQNPKHFVFEDLSLQGYRNADKKAGLDFDQIKMVLTKLSKWHAATALLYEIDQNTMKHHHYRNINEELPHFYPLFTNSIVSCADQAIKWPSSAKVAEKLYKLESTIIAKGCQVFTTNENDFNVLTHGDLWVNNIMYKYDVDGKAEDVTLVDYSIGYYGSPAIDLSYLLFTSSANDVKEREWDLLLQHYHSELVDCLKKLGYSKKLPTLIDIHIDMLRKGVIGVMHATFLIPLRLIEDTANADLAALLAQTKEAKAFRNTLFSHPKYQERMEYLLDYFDRKGFLD